jgi:hypothetical protein
MDTDRGLRRIPGNSWGSSDNVPHCFVSVRPWGCDGITGKEVLQWGSASGQHMAPDRLQAPGSPVPAGPAQSHMDLTLKFIIEINYVLVLLARRGCLRNRKGSSAQKSWVCIPLWPAVAVETAGQADCCSSALLTVPIIERYGALVFARCSIRISAGTLNILPWGSRGFTEPLKADCWTVLRLLQYSLPRFLSVEVNSDRAVNHNWHNCGKNRPENCRGCEVMKELQKLRDNKNQSKQQSR